MRPGVKILSAALFVALVGATSSHEAQRVPRATTATDGTVLIGGVPQFLIGAGWPTPAAVPRALTLGIGVLQENGPGATQLAISKAVGSKGYVVPGYSLKQLHAHYRNAIGYSLPDEPDGNGLLPATADPDAGNRVPYTQRAGKTGVLIMQTLTSHFMDEMPKWDGIGDAEYRAYIANADVVLTDVYPFAHGCADRFLSLSMVYDAMVELKKLAPSKAVGEWIETGPIEGYCGPDPVSSPAARAEAWAAVAGGAQSLFWFTHTFTKGRWDDFDVSWEMGDAIATTNAELERYSKIVLGRRDADIVSTREDSIKVGLRSVGGRSYLIAVNLSGDAVDLGRDVAARAWWPKLPGLTYQGVDELTTGATGTASAGQFADTIPAFGLRIYTWVPRKIVNGRGLQEGLAASGSSTRGSSKLKVDPRPGSEETQIRPSIRVTSSRQMYRPSPLPPTPRVIGASRR
jgi:hypothetical protein